MCGNLGTYTITTTSRPIYGAILRQKRMLRIANIDKRPCRSDVARKKQCPDPRNVWVQSDCESLNMARWFGHDLSNRNAYYVHLMLHRNSDILLTFTGYRTACQIISTLLKYNVAITPLLFWFQVILYSYYCLFVAKEAFFPMHRIEK
jgi:hypothetical protein